MRCQLCVWIGGSEDRCRLSSILEVEIKRACGMADTKISQYRAAVAWCRLRGQRCCMLDRNGGKEESGVGADGHE
jgi:hypothetical protein